MFPAILLLIYCKDKDGPNHHSCTQRNRSRSNEYDKIIINEENNSFSEAEADEISNMDSENAVITVEESDDKNEEADEKLLAL